MAITISSNPGNIDGHGRFTVATDKTVSSSYNNLRIRAEVYHEGVVKAVIEKPKGLSDFDFSDILRSLNYGLKLPRNTGGFMQCGSCGSNLITGWSAGTGTFTTLTTSGNSITSAISTVAAAAQSNTVAMAPGELYLAYSTGFTTTGTNAPQFKLDTGGANWATIANNKGVIIMPTTTGSLRLYVGGQASQNFTGDFFLVKITTDRTNIGGMLVPYFVVFTEVYEDSSGVTQTSATATTQAYRYVPSSRFINTAFSSYVLSSTGSYFANMTLRDGACMFFTSSPSEYFVTFFTEYVHLELFTSGDGAAFASYGTSDCVEGWGVIILSTSRLMSGITNSLRLYVNDWLISTISSVLTVSVDSRCNTYRAILEFIGLTGGTEYLAYNGGAVQGLKSDRNYYTDQYGIRKLISQRMAGNYTLETSFADMYFTDYFAMIFAATDVKLLMGETTEPVDVTVVSEGGKSTSEELFTNEVEIEFDYGF
jgi:hypothetical protein